MNLLTLSEFIKDPGMINRKSFKYYINERKYKQRFEMLTRKISKFDVVIYVENDTSIYYHVIVPSELRANDYDVVIHLISPGNQLDIPIEKWVIRNIFSNNPAFIFEFGYVYYHNDLFLDFLTDKYNNIIFKESPKQKNPDMLIGCDHSVYHAISYLLKHKKEFLDLYYINDKSLVFDKKYISESIKDQETVTKEYNKGKLKNRYLKFIRSDGNETKKKSVYDKVKEIGEKFSRTVSKIGDSITRTKPKITARRGENHRIQKIKPKKKI